MSQSLLKPTKPRIAAFTADTVASVATQVDTKTNALNLTLTNPSTNPTTGVFGTPGAVINGSISVSDITACPLGQGTLYIATVHWNEQVVPA